MNTHKLSSILQRRNLFRVVFALSVASVLVCGLVSTWAQDSAQDDAATPPGEEREFKNTIPAHVPIKVKLKREQPVKDLKNKNWVRDLEIEVKNTGSKPIYYLNMDIIMRDLLEGGYPTALHVSYGRKELFRFSAPLLPDDVPILPGESVTLKVPDYWVRGYEYHREIKNRPDPKKVELNLQLINFGDGTGLLTPEGAPHPDPRRKRSQNVPRQDGVPDVGPPFTDAGGAVQTVRPTARFSPLRPQEACELNISSSERRRAHRVTREIGNQVFG
jgi:hypothetical protein